MRILLPTCMLVLVPLSLLFAQGGQIDSRQDNPRFVQLDGKTEKSKVQELFQAHFRLKAKDNLYFKRSDEDHLGFVHETFQQYFDGLQVEGALYKVHMRNNRVESMSGYFMDVPDELNTEPTISPSAAYAQALRHVGVKKLAVRQFGIPQGRLVVVENPDKKSSVHLAYKFDIYSEEPLYRAWVYVDAHSGEMVRENLRIHHADDHVDAETLYNGTRKIYAENIGGTTRRLRQTTDGGGIQTFDLNNSTNYNNASDVTDSGVPFNSNPTAIQAHWGAEQTHRYFMSAHGRNSFNGAGAVIRSYVSYSSNYVNAFWDGQRMTYGDGDGVNYGPLVSLDIVGHEITHGVTNYAADLIYSYESGALNESFSDIFGEAIEHYALGSNDWQMGTDIGIGGSGAIRSMDNPNAFGDPDTYLGTYWYTGSGDNGGVHINSGVQNKWFYILTEGESGTNDLGNGYNVSAIGMTKAAAIAYRNLAVYLGPSSNYFDARDGAIQSAIDLYGADSPEVIATTNAWYAVGVGGEYGVVSYCASRGNNSSYEWIANVSMGSFSNSSGSAGYTDFTNLEVSVEEGQSYNLSLTPGFGSTVYNEYWKIWIDYNADGDFGDIGELAFDAGGLSASTVSGSISIPNGVGGTTTRMRVSMKWNAAQSACETFSYGEVEDYAIVIGEGAPAIPPLEVQITSATDVTCNGGNDGSATASASSGVGPYTYLWSNGSTSPTVSNLTSGTYTVTATDSEGTTGEASVTINQPAVLSVSTSGTDVSCDGTNDGAASASGAGGTTPYTYLWNGPGVSNVSGESLQGLSTGTYNVTVTDNNGCTANGSVTIGQEDCSGCTTVLINSNSFESGWGIWNDGGSDCRRSANDGAYANGNYCVRLRDNTGSSVMTTDVLNLGGFEEVTIAFSYFPRSMDNSNEDFWLQVSTNGGASYNTVVTWAQGIDFANNNRYNEEVTLVGTFTSNTRFRFRCDASSNADYVYIDDVVITGCGNNSQANSLIASNSRELPEETVLSTEVEKATLELQPLDMLLYPNPVQTELTVAYQLPKTSFAYFRITDLTGRLMAQYQIDLTTGQQEMKIDLSTMNRGFYLIHLVTDQGTLSEKFVLVD